ncbi:hypothetical protein Bca52824_076148 [Brassica carinata]|uniref:Uncharacterized protein n=2 Tax=Brassica TaxID=3705 RepID=A0A8X7PWI5_BRACI|nr:hypothetical protein Bca52824_076148 [Brassica carinata]
MDLAANSTPSYIVFIDIGHCVLFNYFAAEFKERYSIDVCTNTKACVRLRASCEKVKKVLSANAEAPLNIECLMEEKDRLIVPCQKALDDSGLSLDQIHSVELVGSGSRIPAISKKPSSLFKRELGRTVNASECVARGCALQCAMLSPIFRVRDYEVQDSFPFSIGFSSDKDWQFYGMLSTLRLCCSILVHFKFPTEKQAARVKVRVQLNLHGIVTIDSASLIEDRKENMTSEEMISENNHQSSAAKVDTSSSTNDPKAIKRTEIPVVGNVSGALTKDELLEAKHREYSLVEQDLKMESTKDKKNALESFVYEMRDKMLNTYRNTATESERECIVRNLQETEEWLYEDGDDESENAYIEKLNDIRKLIDPIENRFKG